MALNYCVSSIIMVSIYTGMLPLRSRTLLTYYSITSSTLILMILMMLMMLMMLLTMRTSIEKKTQEEQTAVVGVPVPAWVRP